MLGIKYKAIWNKDNLISPQGIMVYGEYQFIFDRINLDDGRLYKFDSNSNKYQLVMNIDDGECFFGRDGYIYILHSDINSRVEVYDIYGKKLNDIVLKGTTYLIDIDENGYIYGVFSENDKMFIDMYDKSSNFIRTIHSRTMPLISTICCHDDFVYAGGYNKDGGVTIEKVNHISFVEGSYIIHENNSKSIISKILNYKGNLISILSCKSRDSLLIIDIETGEERNIKIPSIKSIYDIYIKDDNIFIVSGEKAIFEYELTDEYIELEPKKLSKKLSKNSNHRYILFLIMIKNLLKDFSSIFMKIGLPLSIITIFFSKIGFTAGIDKSTLLLSSFLRNFEYVFVLSISITIFLVITKNLFIPFKKKSRVDNILGIYGKIDSISSTAFFNSFILGMAISISLLSLILNGSIFSNENIKMTIEVGLLLSVIIYLISKHCIAKFKKNMNGMVFELLSFGIKDHDIFTIIESQVRRARKAGTDKFSIKILFEDNSNNMIYSVIKKWSRLREKITGDRGVVKDYDEYLVLYIDLQNRDIKYSRLSLIEDFICYISSVGKVSSVVIEPGEKENK